VNSGKTLFAQLMDFLPWSTFTRIVARYGGDQRVRTLSCAEHYRAMAFAQLTYRESLRDIAERARAARSSWAFFASGAALRRSAKLVFLDLFISALLHGSTSGRSQTPRSDIYVRRTYSGRPSSSIRFSEATAMATSVICRPLVRERSASPITRL
jgi:hypothetical protein